MLSESTGLLLIFGSVVAFLVLGYLLLAALLPAETEEVADEPTLVEAAAAVRPAKSWSERLDRRFDRMMRGTNWGLTARGGIEWVLFVGSVLAVVGYLLTRRVEGALAGFLFGAMLPLAVFAAAQNRYRAAVRDQLADGCSQLARSLRAGLSLEAALETAAGYAPLPLSDVFRNCGKRLAMGLTPPVAFHAVAEELQLTDFEQVASVIALHSRTGGDLPHYLDRVATSIRDRQQFRGYFASATSLSVISAGFVAVTPIILAIYYAVSFPELFNNFFKDRFGMLMLLVAVVAQITGMIWVALLLRRQSRY
ncbi:type II secretion system F family protein [Tuwongella immobilis]|uniref:Type II secretion system protein GspF domain-containing protein n=1 Tax=Tuwongella immobilis TaxID=692036 RepID=A0A6C2YY39_9BACT|nr:type II secretion system F family protein [Tuwongella immobilis]VIP05702.1 Secretion system protein TadB OS=Planctomyces maris DSM 8797 GN=PM8797T_00574 PE=4 SV=1: T2SF [Tuwongella immobilis]VTS08760.1 Secretion system protein TadB OS=Planctomyces maris DSM 8797 GN=PM8797T_00574 PE=4 SV=1: T2SF [Tuwongella immobilis]